jgi:hypothetical protein
MLIANSDSMKENPMDTQCLASKRANLYERGYLYEKLASWILVDCNCIGLVAMENSLKNQQTQIHALEEKLADRTKIALLDLQERCLNQARKEFESLGWKAGKGDVYESHYNAEMNKCFMLSEINSIGLSTSKFLSDAYEGKVYGDFMFIPDKVKGYWEIPPKRCTVTMPTGEEKKCTSL